MASFDFISDENFRASLESDYREIEAALEAKAWKAVHVLAGSIIEAVLADYLLSTGYREQQLALNPRAKDTSIDPLKMSLGALIEACKAKGVLTERSVALSRVVQSYRNLIHPGRLIRLKESIDQDGATVAKSLVEMIVREVANKRRETFGLTAVQVVKKVVQDPDAVTFIDHLLRGMGSSELEHLLLSETPDTYLHNLNYARQVSHDYTCLGVLSLAFRAGFERATNEIKKKVIWRFVTIIREESQQTVIDYEDAFFQASDLEYLPASEAHDQVSLVKQQLLLQLGNRTVPAAALVRWTRGFGRYIETKDEAGRLAWHLAEQMASQYEEFSGYQAFGVWSSLAHEMKSRPDIYAAFVKSLNREIEEIAERAGRTQDVDLLQWLDQEDPKLKLN